MAKKITSSTAAKAADEETILPADGEQADAATGTSSAASSPSGGNGPDGTNTSGKSDSGAVAGSTSVEPVKPQGDASQTGAIVAEAETGTSNPKEAETAASGTIFGSSSQGGTAEATGANAGAFTGLSAEQVTAIQSRLLGVTIKERREFIAYKTVRHNNVLYERGARIRLDFDGHKELSDAQAVASDWRLGLVVEG